jgi:NAD-dependent dihydropyrimidine dehydrogenase PreA subunit
VLPSVEPTSQQRRGGRAWPVITSNCIGTKDASCTEACPVNAIYSEDQAPDSEQVFIDRNAAYYRQAGQTA